MLLLVMVSVTAWAVPPPEPGAVEVVGGVEVAADPEKVLDKNGRVADSAEEAKKEEKGPPLSPGDSILKDIDFDPRSDGYDEKIASLFLEQKQLEEVLRQMTNLDDDDFRRRNDASKKLAMLEAPVEHLLSAARKDSSVEMSRRVQAILNVRIKRRIIDALYHASNRVAIEAIPGWTERLMVMSSTFDPVTYWELLRVMEIAAARSSREQDRDFLKEGLSADAQSSRELCAFVLGYLGDDRAVASGVPDIDEFNELILLANARGRAAAGGKGAGKVLVGLLSSKELRVRHEAGSLLRAIYAKDFGFTGYDLPETRIQALERWENYISNGGEQELKSAILGVSARGNFQVIVGKRPGKGGTVSSYTTSGKKLENSGLAASMSGAMADKIAYDYWAGNVVVSGGSELDGKVTVFSMNGTELWNVSGVPAGSGAAVIPGGKVLVAAGNEVEILDVLGDSSAGWKMQSPVVSFAQLRKDRFLCSHPDDGTVIEYDSEGVELWKLGGLDRPRNVHRLQNGNLLIVVSRLPEGGEDNAGDEQIELLELSADGQQTVARIQPKGVKSITSSARLPNGNTLIGTEKGLAEYTPDGYAVSVWLKSPISSLHVD